MTRPASRPNRRAVLLGLPLVPLALQGCAAPSVWASDEAVAQAYAPVTGETALTLFTMKNSGSDNGAHTALMIEADQRVIFDPAGSFETAALPERNDLIYGVTEQVAEVYVSFHARDEYYVVAQRVAVPPETAQAALALAQQAGPVPRTRCTIATGRLLQQLEGFEGIRPALFPDRLMDQMARIPGVETRITREEDGGTLEERRQALDARLGAAAD